MIEWSTAPQGSEEWHEARRGAITGSMFRVAREKLKTGQPSAKALLYAMNVARERVGGRAPAEFVNAAMRFGTEQEPEARMAYEDATGSMVETVGFAKTDDGKFGCSVDGLVDADGMVEFKTIVSSDTLFKVLVDGDISEYLDQINGGLWLLCRKWCDLGLWTPDLPTGRLTIVRVHRDEAAIEALEGELVAFDRRVSALEADLRARLKCPKAAAKPDVDMDEALPRVAVAPNALPALFG